MSRLLVLSPPADRLSPLFVVLLLPTIPDAIIRDVVSGDAKDLLRRLLVKDDGTRLDATAVLEHRYVYVRE